MTTPLPRLGALCCAFGLSLASAIAQTGFSNWESAQVNPLALTPSGNTLLAVNTADNRLEVFDTSGGTTRWVRSISVGVEPVSVRARSETQAWVVNSISDSISIVDLPSGRVIRTLGTGDEPADVVFAGSPLRAFVSNSQANQVQVFDPANLGAAPGVIAIQGSKPRSLAVNAAGNRVYVGIFSSGNKTTVLNAPVVSNPGGPYGGLNPPPNDGTVFSPPLTPGLPPPPQVSQIVRQNASGQWLDDNGRNWSQFVTWGLHDQDVAIIDTTTLGVTFARGMMTTVMNLTVAPSGDITAIGTEALNEIRFAPNVNGIFLRVVLSKFNPATPATVSTVDLNPHLDYTTASVPPATRALSIGDPRGIAWQPDGSRAFVSGMGSNNVIVLDAAGGRLGQVAVGQGPTGLAMRSNGSRLFVLNRFDASVSVIDTVTLSEVQRVEFYDPTPSAIREGRPMLYDTQRTSGTGHLSCASCHIDGRNDGLAWDLGDPSGALKAVDIPCRQGPGNCRPWHPMKGPMVTQSLQGIVQAGAMHWRGDRENLAAFSGAFVDLQGLDAAPSAADMQAFTDFVATIKYPPNPLRNQDGSLPTALPVAGGTGNAQNGFTLYQTAPLFGGALTCVACHALPLGTDGTIDSPAPPPGGPPIQSLKVVQLRGLNDKVGFNRGSQTNNRGVGYDHDSDRDTLGNLLAQPPFTFPPNPGGAQQRRDMEAFMLAFTNDSHAAVGKQITFDGVNNGDVNLLNRLNTFLTQADNNAVGLVVKGRRNGVDRGWAYVGGGLFQSDRAGEMIDETTLLASATGGSELTYTVVTKGTEVGIGIDRDVDGYFDRDEVEACSNPADPTIIPGSPQAVLTGDTNGDRIVDLTDLAALLANYGKSPATLAEGDVDHDGDVDLSDVAMLLGNFGRTCG